MKIVSACNLAGKRVIRKIFDIEMLIRTLETTLQTIIPGGTLKHEWVNQHMPTVNSRKSRTLFINYDFRWLMVAEIY